MDSFVVVSASCASRFVSAISGELSVSLLSIVKVPELWPPLLL